MPALRGTDPNHAEEKDFQDSSPDKLSLHPPNNWPKSHTGLGLQFHRPLILFIITFSLYYYFGKGVLDHFSIFIYWAPALCQAGLEGRGGETEVPGVSASKGDEYPRHQRNRRRAPNLAVVGSGTSSPRSHRESCRIKDSPLGRMGSNITVHLQKPGGETHVKNSKERDLAGVSKE